MKVVTIFSSTIVLLTALTAWAKTDVVTSDDFAPPLIVTARSAFWTVSSANGEPECIYKSPTSDQTVIVGPEWIKQLCPPARSYPTAMKANQESIETAACVDGGFLGGIGAPIPLFYCAGTRSTHTSQSNCNRECNRLGSRG